MIKISIIIPVYNAARYLAQSLDSLLGQTLKDIEVICIDDCSTDNSLDILKKYEKKDPRIKIISFSRKQNAAIARNAGLHIAHGQYLGFVDSDDFIDLDFYEKLYTKATETGADIIKGNALTVELNGTERKSVVNEYIRQNKMNFLSQWWTAIYKRAMIEENAIRFPEECPKAQDVVFLNRCLTHANSVNILDNCFYHYIRRENSLDSKKLPDASVESEMRAINYILMDLNDCYPEHLDKNGYLIAYTNRCLVFLSGYFKTDSTEIKQKELKYLIDAYNTCQEKESFWSLFACITVRPFLENGDIENLQNFMQQWKNYDTFWQKQVCMLLNKRIKEQKNG